MKSTPMPANTPVNTGATLKTVTFGNGGGSRPAPLLDAPAATAATTVTPGQETASKAKLTNNTPVIEPVRSDEPSKALESLTRKEQEIRRAQQSLKLAQEQWKAEQSGYISKKELQEHTLKMLSENGIDSQRLIELQLSNGQSSDPIQSEISTLRAEIAAIRSSTDQRDVQARQQAEAVVHNDAKLLVENDPSYSVTKATGSAHEVSNLIIKQFDATGELLSVEDAAKLVEAELTERSLAQWEKLKGIDAIRTRLQPSDVPVVVDGQPDSRLQPSLQNALRSQRPSPTLTNRTASTRPLTNRERAIEAFERTRLKR